MWIPAPGGAIARHTPSPARKMHTPTYQPCVACTWARKIPVGGPKMHIAKTDTKNIFSRSMLDILATCYDLREQVDDEGDQASQKAAYCGAQRNVFE